MDLASAHRRRRRAPLWRLGLIALVIAGCAALFETVSSASPPVTGVTAAVPAVAPVRAPAIAPLTPLATRGTRTVSAAAPATSPRLAGAPVAQPAEAHQLQGPLPRALDQNVAYSSNWSGQVLTGATYTGVGGQWTVPSLASSGDAEYSATWIGIDGWTSSSLIQTGTTQETSGAGTTYFAWVELLPGASVPISNAPVAPGDVMQAAISETATNVWSITIEDTTANWSYSGSFDYSTPGVSAEWVEEAPTVGASQSTLADFGSATITDMQVGGSTGSSVLTPIVMMNPAQTAFLAYPGPYDQTTGSFTDHYGAPPPVVTSISPAEGAVGGGTSVVITGDFLLGVNGVAFEPFSANYTANSNGTVSAVSPPEAAGTVDVRVDTPGGWSAYTGADRFTYAPPASPVASPSQSTPAPHGYWLVGGDGGIFTFGAAQFWGSTGSLSLQRPVVGITPTRTHDGYWLVASDGGIFTFGTAGFYGSIPGLGYRPAGTPGDVRRLNAPVVGMVPSADGGGYFMVASDGGVFAFGDARFEGSCPGIGGCSGTAVAVMPDASGNGYWLVTATGHVYSFGDAPYYGAPTNGDTVSSAVRTPDGKGYWILGSDGSIAPFGDALYLGSLHAGTAGGLDPASAIAATSDGSGYWISLADGDVFAFGDAPYDGGMAGNHLNAPIIAAVGW